MTFTKHQSQHSKTILTPAWRIAYPWFDEPRTKQSNGALMQTPRHDATVCVPKLNNDPSQCANYMMLYNLACEAAMAAWPAQGGAQWQWPVGGMVKIQNGDDPIIPKLKPGQAPLTPEEFEALQVKYAWRDGNWIIEITSGAYRPAVAVTEGGQSVDIPTRVINGQAKYKSGDYAMISLYTFTYHHESGKFGAKFGFDAVLFTKPGDRIGSSGGAKSAASIFSGVVRAGGPATSAPYPYNPAPAALVPPGALVQAAPPAYPVAAPMAPPAYPAAIQPAPPAYPVAAPMAPPAYPAAAVMGPPPGGLPPFPR